MGGEVGTREGKGIKMDKLLCTKQVKYKDVMCSTENLANTV